MADIMTIFIALDPDTCYVSKDDALMSEDDVVITVARRHWGGTEKGCVVTLSEFAKELSDDTSLFSLDNVRETMTLRELKDSARTLIM